MDIQISKYEKGRIRVNSSGYILRQSCVNSCPQENLETTDELDLDHVEYLKYK